MKKTPEKEIFNRIQHLKEHLEKNDIDFALIIQKVDQFYYSGTVQDGVLLVPRIRPPVLFIKRSLIRAKEESVLDYIMGYKSYRDIYEYVSDSNIKRRKIGLEIDIIPARNYLLLQSLFPSASFVDISSFIRRRRALKSEFEISLLVEGGKRLDKVLTKVKDDIKPGITEYELYNLLNSLLLKEGSSPFIRTRMFNMEVLSNCILSGRSAAKPSSIDSPSAGGEGVTIAYPIGAGYKKLRAMEPIAIDTVFNYEGYNIDCTRIFAIDRLNRKFKHAHEVSKNCHELFIEQAKKGAFIPDIYRDIKAVVKNEGLADVFMGGVKFVGHGIGLELDEFPIISERYEDYICDRMVIAFEPKFVFDSGIVGYETSYYLRNCKLEALSSYDVSIQYL